MARPLTMSPPLRIPLTQWQRLNTRATTKGQTVGEYLASLIESHLGPEPGKQSADVCPHPRSKVSLIGGGLARCSCGAMRNMRGVWS